MKSEFSRRVVKFFFFIFFDRSSHTHRKGEDRCSIWENEEPVQQERVERVNNPFMFNASCWAYSLDIARKRELVELVRNQATRLHQTRDPAIKHMRSRYLYFVFYHSCWGAHLCGNVFARPYYFVLCSVPLEWAVRVRWIFVEFVPFKLVIAAPIFGQKLDNFIIYYTRANPSFYNFADFPSKK